MITLHQFPPAWNLPNPSPFCIKVEAYLKFSGIEYKNHYSIRTTINPKKKFPCIQIGDKVLGDSELIIDYLKSEFGDTLDKDLSKEQVAQGILIERLLGEHLYWCVVNFRWNHEPEWTEIKKTFFGKVPKLLQSCIAGKIKKSFVKAMYNQGSGRHSFAELISFIEKDLMALSVILGGKEFILGTDTPTSYDCTAYGFLENLYGVPFDHPPKEAAEKYDNLKQYCHRMRERFQSAS